MKIKTKMFYLGKKFVNNEGKKNDKGQDKGSYFMVRMEDADDNLYEWYLPAKNEFAAAIAFLEKAKKYTEVQVMLEIGSYQGKPRVDLVGVAE
jgi:hypothetical protein